MKSDVENFVEVPWPVQLNMRQQKLPSDVFLWAALASIAASLALQMLDHKHDALFVGQWAPTILLLGVYNKLVKQLGSDPGARTSKLGRWGRLWPNAARNCAAINVSVEASGPNSLGFTGARHPPA